MARGASPSSKRTRSGLDTSHKIRLQDIAELTGVGIATVDRVLNERGNVAPQTAEKVLAVAREPLSRSLGQRRTAPEFRGKPGHHFFLRKSASCWPGTLIWLPT